MSGRRIARARPVVRLLAAWPLAVFVVGAAGAADLSFEQLLAELHAHAHRQDRFTERLTTPLLDRPVEASGELFYDAPDHLEKRTLKPRPERLVLEGRALTVERRQRTHHTTLDEFPELAPYIESIRATLAGDRAALERLFRVEFQSHGTDWSLGLVPLATSRTVGVARIRIEGTAGEVRSVLIERTNGDRSVLVLTGAVAP